jgi:chromosomal replication initiation ATPase DnaA
MDERLEHLIEWSKVLCDRSVQARRTFDERAELAREHLEIAKGVTWRSALVRQFLEQKHKPSAEFLTPPKHRRLNPRHRLLRLNQRRGGQRRAHEPALPATANGTATAGREGRTQLDPRYTVAQFVVGLSNQFAHAAAQAVAARPGEKYDPL